MSALLIAYTSAGFDPHAFWWLTFRLYDLHMQGAAERIEREISIGNRNAWNNASMTGSAFAGKLPSYERIFRKKIPAGVTQSAAQLQANLKALARAWGAASS